MLGFSRRAATILSIVELLSVRIAAAHAQDAEILTEPPHPAEHSTQGAEPSPALALQVGGSPAPQADQEHLDEWLQYVARTSRTQRLMQGSSMLIAGSVVMGVGIPLYVRHNPGTEIDKGLGLAAIAASGVYLGFGIVRLASESAAEKQLARWQAAKGSGLSIRELARFEGELRNYGELARRELVLGRWMSFAMALTGGLMMGLTPAAGLSRDGATIGYAGGAILLGVGFLDFGLSFRKAAVPDYWDAYLSGKRPPPAVKWSAAPIAGPKLAGASIVGRF
ncbi:MAG: hypothetical protein WCF10_15515 [Polyangiales bacterium]